MRQIERVDCDLLARNCNTLERRASNSTFKPELRDSIDVVVRFRSFIHGECRTIS